MQKKYETDECGKVDFRGREMMEECGKNYLIFKGGGGIMGERR